MSRFAATVALAVAAAAIVADIEITDEEIVDVAITPRNTRDSSLRDCIAERMWDTTLVLFDPPLHATLNLEFQP